MFRLFEGLTQPFPEDQTVPPPANLVAFCRYYATGMWPVILLVSFLSGAIAALEVTLFGFLGTLVDAIANTDPQVFFQQESSNIVWIGAVVLLMLPLLVMLQSLFSHQSLMGNFPMRIRWSAHRHLLNQSVEFFHNEFAGRIATKVMQTSLAVRETVLKMMDLLVYVTVYFSSIVVLVIMMDWRLGIPFLIWLSLYLIILKFLIPRLKKVSQKQANARSEMTGRVVDSYTNVTTVKLFSHSAREAQYARDSMSAFLQTVYPQMRLVTVLESLVWLSNTLLIFSVAGLGLYFWRYAIVSPGDIAVSVSLAMRLNGMAQWIMWEVSGLFENIGMVQDGMETLSKPVNVQDVPDAEPISIRQGEIEFKNVHFSYQSAKNSVPVFQQLNLKIAAGEKVGIVGPSGAGKSTLVNLLLRFYDVQKGDITIDEQNIKELQQESLRAQISMVTQDTSLLHRTIRENILYGKEKATEEELIAAAKHAEAHHFIQSLSDHLGNTGYDAHVGERGVKLSGGQRQRIAIARVLLKDAPILILDEATSALDSEVEVAIQECLYKIMENKTVLAIAHRLSTIAAMDRLVVFEQGQIVESGTHKELLSMNGRYAKLWAHQTGGFLGLE
ncbi:MAG: ABC transporter ATP-binding protein [Aestuariibacter sp.]